MKIKKYFWISLMILSCSPPVVFDGPYPANEKDLSEIPTQFQGAYQCESDSSIILINEYAILHRQDYVFLTHIDTIRDHENCGLIGQEMYIESENTCIPVKYLNDSIVEGHFTKTDTLFYLSEKSKARLYEGHLILSIEIDDTEWAVNILHSDKYDNVIYKSITEASEINEIQKITPMKDISNKNSEIKRYKVSPTPIEFQKLFYNDKVFLECDYLVRINLEQMTELPFYF